MDYDYRFVTRKATRNRDGKVFAKPLAGTLIWIWLGCCPERSTSRRAGGKLI